MKMIPTILIAVLYSSALLAQDVDVAELSKEMHQKFANEKIPKSIQNFSFFETYGTFVGRQLPHQLDTLSPFVIQASFKRNYLDVANITIKFSTQQQGLFYSAQATSMLIQFKTKTQCDAYLKKLGQSITTNRWDFDLKEIPCMGVQVYKQNEKTIEIKTFNDCGAG
jgi:hypothetical protein